MKTRKAAQSNIDWYSADMKLRHHFSPPVFCNTRAKSSGDDSEWGRWSLLSEGAGGYDYDKNIL